MKQKVIICGLVLLGQIMAQHLYAAEVYVTKNGKKYHKADCEFIKDRSTIKMDDSEAIKKGLKPCGACFKDNQITQNKQK